MGKQSQLLRTVAERGVLCPIAALRKMEDYSVRSTISTSLLSPLSDARRRAGQRCIGREMASAESPPDLSSTGGSARDKRRAALARLKSRSRGSPAGTEVKTSATATLREPMSELNLAGAAGGESDGAGGALHSALVTCLLAHSVRVHRWMRRVCTGTMVHYDGLNEHVYSQAERERDAGGRWGRGKADGTLHSSPEWLLIV